MPGRNAIAGALGAALAVTLGVACARDSSAQSASSERVVPDDTAAVTRLLGSVRGADKLFCELATRSVDQHGSWSNYGSIGGASLEVDSASSELIRWIGHKHNDPALVPRLKTAIRDQDACVRRVGASFLARVEHPSATSALLDGIGDSRAEVREVSAYGLGIAEFKDAADELIRLMKDASPGVRRASAWALGAIESKRAQPALMEALTRDSDPKVRQTAAWALGNIK